MSILSTIEAWVTGTDNSAVAQQNATSLYAAAVANLNAGNVSQDDFDAFVSQLGNLDTTSAIDNSNLNGLGEGPLQTFEETASSQGTALITDVSHLDLAKLLQDLGLGIEGATAGTKPIAPLLGTDTTWMILAAVFFVGYIVVTRIGKR